MIEPCYGQCGLRERIATLEAENAQLRTDVCTCCREDRPNRDGHPAFCQPGCGCWGRCGDPTCCEPDVEPK